MNGHIYCHMYFLQFAMCDLQSCCSNHFQYYLDNLYLSLFYLVSFRSMCFDCFHSNNMHQIHLSFLYNNQYYLYMYLHYNLRLFLIMRLLHNRSLLVLLHLQILQWFDIGYLLGMFLHHFQSIRSYLDLLRHIYMNYLQLPDPHLYIIITFIW